MENKKVELAKETCKNILRDNHISPPFIIKFVSKVLDAIDLVGIDNEFTRTQENEIIEYVRDLVKQKETGAKINVR